ncbi:hypothetical protein Q7C36_017943 [Tachysurus vachellii]|uniref:Uncharacterized protein n=1 Tax=Tachysurus vachellii TaxID=175792 RepID=A0AA88LZ08_TACVA|nr:hypothetical protein Q7C36_017943 [Tachysurus vachellii]
MTSNVLQSLHKDTTNQKMRTAALLGLPWYMRETPSKFMRICEPSDPEEDVIKAVVIGILVVVENVMEPLPAFYNDVALVIEEEVLMHHLTDIPNAFLNLMGLVYALNLDYPKELKFTFEAIQRLFIELDQTLLFICCTGLNFKSIVVFRSHCFKWEIGILEIFFQGFLVSLYCFIFPCFFL